MTQTWRIFCGLVGGGHRTPRQRQSKVEELKESLDSLRFRLWLTSSICTLSPPFGGGLGRILFFFLRKYSKYSSWSIRPRRARARTHTHHSIFSLNQLNSDSKLPSGGLVQNSVVAGSVYLVGLGSVRIGVYVVPGVGKGLRGLMNQTPAWSVPLRSGDTGRGRRLRFSHLPCWGLTNSPGSCPELCGESLSLQDPPQPFSYIRYFSRAWENVLSLEECPWAPKSKKENGEMEKSKMFCVHENLVLPSFVNC